MSNLQSRSSSGGEGQGEEAVALNTPARWAGGEPRWKRSLDGNREKQQGPPLPARSSRGGREKHPHIVREMAAALASAAPAQGFDGQDMNVVIEMAQTRQKLSNYVDVNT